MSHRLDNWRDYYAKAYEKRLTVVRNHIGVGYKRQAHWEKEMAKLVLVRMCKHVWTATTYTDRFIILSCSHCKFSFFA